MKLIETPSRLGEKKRHFQKALQFEKTSVTVIQMREGEVMAEHSTDADALIIVRKGLVDMTVGEERISVTPENLLHLDPAELHSLTAREDSEVLLVQIKR